MLAVAAVAATVAAGSGMVAAQGGHGLLGLEGPFDIAVDLRGHKVVPGPGDPNGRAALGLNTDTRRRESAGSCAPRGLIRSRALP